MKAIKFFAAAALAAVTALGAAALSAGAYDDGNLSYLDCDFESNEKTYHGTISGKDVMQNCRETCIEITSVKYDGKYLEICWNNPGDFDMYNIQIYSKGEYRYFQAKIRTSGKEGIDASMYNSKQSKLYYASESEARFTVDVEKAVELGIIDLDYPIIIAMEGVKNFDFSKVRRAHTHTIQNLLKYPKSSKITPTASSEKIINTTATNIKVYKDSKTGNIVFSWDEAADDPNTPAYKNMQYSCYIDKQKKFKNGLNYQYVGYAELGLIGADKWEVSSIESKEILNDKDGYYRIKIRPDTGYESYLYFRPDEIPTEEELKQQEEAKAAEASAETKPAEVKVPEKLPAAKNIKLAKATKTAVQLKWEAVDGADAYAVYVYNASTKKYEKYKTVSGNSCAVKNLKSGKKYKIKVVTLDKVNGKYVQGGAAAITVSTKK